MRGCLFVSPASKSVSHTFQLTQITYQCKYQCKHWRPYLAPTCTGEDFPVSQNAIPGRVRRNLRKALVFLANVVIESDKQGPMSPQTLEFSQIFFYTHTSRFCTHTPLKVFFRQFLICLGGIAQKQTLPSLLSFFCVCEGFLKNALFEPLPS